ncbi:MAG: DoxX family protein [Gemmatimonadota bacterium]|nr:DoxX family protein [Gemmatimonadota bacterium]
MNERPGIGIAALRVVAGLIFIMHGYPKLFGGIEGAAGFFGSLGIPLPTVAAWFIALLETVGGLALILGVFVTPFAALLALHMLAGILLVHIENGFYVVGPGQGGVEFNLLLIASMLVLIFAGPGAFSIDEKRASSSVT